MSEYDTDDYKYVKNDSDLWFLMPRLWFKKQTFPPVSTLPKQRGAEEVIRLNFCVWNPEGFYSPLWEARLKISISDNNSSDSPWIWIRQHETEPPSEFPDSSLQVKILSHWLSNSTHKALGEEMLQTQLWWEAVVWKLMYSVTLCNVHSEAISFISSQSNTHTQTHMSVQSCLLDVVRFKVGSVHQALVLTAHEFSNKKNLKSQTNEFFLQNQTQMWPEHNSGPFFLAWHCISYCFRLYFKEGVLPFCLKWDHGVMIKNCELQKLQASSPEPSVLILAMSRLFLTLCSPKYH